MIFDEANSFGENVQDYEEEFQIGLFNQSKELIENFDVPVASKKQAESSDEPMSKPKSSDESIPVDFEEDLGQASQVQPTDSGGTSSENSQGPTESQTIGGSRESGGNSYRSWKYKQYHQSDLIISDVS